MQGKENRRLPVTIMRGGASKGTYLLQSDLPENQDAWEALLLRLMGSPDKKQIDGLGGSQSVTSKVAIVQKSAHPAADVDYTFAQVSVDKPLVSYKGNCGNISSGMGPFAIEKGLVPAKDGVTSMRIFNTNTNKIIIADVQTPGGEVEYSGDFAIADVPGTANLRIYEFCENPFAARDKRRLRVASCGFPDQYAPNAAFRFASRFPRCGAERLCPAPDNRIADNSIKSDIYSSIGLINAFYKTGRGKIRKFANSRNSIWILPRP